MLSPASKPKCPLRETLHLCPIGVGPMARRESEAAFGPVEVAARDSPLLERQCGGRGDLPAHEPLRIQQTQTCSDAVQPLLARSFQVHCVYDVAYMTNHERSERESLQHTHKPVASTG